MRLLALLAVFALPALLVAAPVPKDEKPKDEDAILGTWKGVSYDYGGAPDAPKPEEVAKARFIFGKDGKVKLIDGSNGEEVGGSYKLNPAAKVKTIDLVLTRPGDEQPDTILGIYDLDGDTLKLCINHDPKTPRPEAIKADSKLRIVITLARVKGEKDEEKKKDK